MSTHYQCSAAGVSLAVDDDGDLACWRVKSTSVGEPDISTKLNMFLATRGVSVSQTLIYMVIIPKLQ